jgi:hypothetical protein
VILKIINFDLPMQAQTTITEYFFEGIRPELYDEILLGIERDCLWLE